MVQKHKKKKMDRMKPKARATKNTSVTLTPYVEGIKHTLAPLYGLTNLVSAGILLFGELSATEREQAVACAKGVESDDLVRPIQRTKTSAISAQSAAKCKQNASGFWGHFRDILLL